VVCTWQVEITCDVKPHYKLGKPNSNFVLKLLFNALAKKYRAEGVSLFKRFEGAFNRVTEGGWMGEGNKMRLIPSPSASV
jgi:hypothetical protein